MFTKEAAIYRAKWGLLGLNKYHQNKKKANYTKMVALRKIQIPVTFINLAANILDIIFTL
jgi:hypothetical protein